MSDREEELLSRTTSVLRNALAELDNIGRSAQSTSTNTAANAGFVPSNASLNVEVSRQQRASDNFRSVHR